MVRVYLLKRSNSCSGFDGLVLSPGASGQLAFDLPVEKLAVADANGTPCKVSMLLYQDHLLRAPRTLALSNLHPKVLTDKLALSNRRSQRLPR